MDVYSTGANLKRKKPRQATSKLMLRCGRFVSSPVVHAVSSIASHIRPTSCRRRCCCPLLRLRASRFSKRSSEQSRDEREREYKIKLGSIVAPRHACTWAEAAAQNRLKGPPADPRVLLRPGLLASCVPRGQHGRRRAVVNKEAPECRRQHVMLCEDFRECA